MMPTIREILHRAAAEPRRPLDLDRLMGLGKRRRRMRYASATALVVAAVGAAGSLAAVALPRPDPPAADPTAVATPGPSRPLDWPAGWTDLPEPPQVRHHGATQWTGDTLLMWGGSVPAYTLTPAANGYVFDAGARRWTDLPPAPLSARAYPASAWTGAELLVWGGLANEASGGLGDGAAYNPARRSWRTLPAAPISPRAPLGVWTGEELIVWGTAVRTGSPPRDGAAYRPATNTWRRIADAPIELSDAVAVWTGHEMIVFGAELSPADNSPATPTAIGAAYDPAADTWRRLPDSRLSPQASTAAWDGRELIAWDYQSGTAAYDPVRGDWRSIPRVPFDPIECRPRSVAVGRQIFGEFCGSMAVYRAERQQWRSVTRQDLVGWWVELVPAGATVLVLGKSLENGREVFLAFRP
jgi:hypothetical protein